MISVNKKLITIVAGNIPSFIKTQNPISRPFLFEKFCNSLSHGLVCAQFLAAFNIYLKGGPKLFKDAMTEFFDILSMQAFSKSDDSVFLNLPSLLN